MDNTVRMASRTVRRELRICFVVQNSFRQDRARPISGTEKKHVVMSGHLNHSFVARQDDPQPACSYPLFAVAGFFARMNALANLPPRTARWHPHPCPVPQGTGAHPPRCRSAWARFRYFQIPPRQVSSGIPILRARRPRNLPTTPRFVEFPQARAPAPPHRKPQIAVRPKHAESLAQHAVFVAR